MTCENILFSSVVYIVLILIIGPVGNYICRKIVAFTKISKVGGSSKASVDKEQETPSSQKDEDKNGNQRAGWLIGILERSLIAIGIIFGSWEILVAVVALKTVARYKELDQQINAEYFLIGSMASILVSVISAIALIIYDHFWGFSLLTSVKNLVH